MGKLRYLLPLMLFCLPVQVFADSIHLSVRTKQLPFTPHNEEHFAELDLTIIPGAGVYWDRLFAAFTVPGSAVYEVTAISGTFDGRAISGMLPFGPDGRNWIYKGVYMGNIVFGFEGGNAGISDDHSEFILGGIVDLRLLPLVPMTWTAGPIVSDVPEPATVLTFLIGLAVMGKHVRSKVYVASQENER